MATPSYTTDLITLNTGESITGWTEPTRATAGGIAVAEVVDNKHIDTVQGLYYFYQIGLLTADRLQEVLNA